MTYDNKKPMSVPLTAPPPFRCTNITAAAHAPSVLKTGFLFTPDDSGPDRQAASQGGATLLLTSSSEVAKNP